MTDKLMIILLIGIIPSILIVIVSVITNIIIIRTKVEEFKERYDQLANKTYELKYSQDIYQIEYNELKGRIEELERDNDKRG